MPTTDSTDQAPEPGAASFFARPFVPGEAEALADGVSAWLRSEPLRWLIENVPGRRQPGEPAEPLRWPRQLNEPGAATGRAGLERAVAALGEVCEWARHGTVWDYRVGGERREDADSSPAGADLTAAVAARAEQLGLRSTGRLRSRPQALVVLGGRRRAPLNRARAAAEAIAADGLAARVFLLTSHRVLDRDERESEEVRDYAAGARTEADLMRAAARRAFGADPADGDAGGGDPADDDSGGGEVVLVEAPAPPGARRASTFESLAHLGGRLSGPVGVVTSPTCRPFQYLDAVRALGLGAGLELELIAHPPAWAAAAGAPTAAPHVYLQEIRSVVQAAGRLSAALAGGPATAGAARPTPA